MALQSVRNFSRAVQHIFENRFNYPRASNDDITFEYLRRFKTALRCEPNLERRVRVKGPGVEAGVTILPNDFQIKIGDLDLEYLTVDFQGPSYIHVDHELKRGGILKISYKVKLQGTYLLKIKYQGVHVPGSPYNVCVKECEVQPVPKRPIPNYKLIRAYGKGLKSSRQGEVASFEIDTRKAVGGHLLVYVDCADARLGRPCEILFISTNNGYRVEYTCPNEGRYYIRVKCDRGHIKGSPFSALCLPKDAPVPKSLFLSLKNYWVPSRKTTHNPL